MMNGCIAMGIGFYYNAELSHYNGELGDCNAELNHYNGELGDCSAELMDYNDGWN